MALQQDSSWHLPIAACSCAAIGIAAYGLGTGSLTVPLAAGGLLALGAGTLLTQIRDYLSRDGAQALDEMLHHFHGRLERAEQAGRSWQVGQENLREQIAALQSDSLSGTAALSRGLEDIRQAHTSLAQQIEAVMNRPPVVQTVYAPQPAQNVYAAPYLPEQQTYQQQQAVLPPEPQVISVAPVQSLPPPPPAEDDTPFGNRLSLALEPIVDLYTSQTAHYRLVASMIGENGQEVAPELFAHHVAQLGHRALLDAFIVRETIAILGELRKRDPNLCVLVQVGATTLADRQHLQAILGYVAAHPEAAAGLVLDINHGVLASLPDASLEGLAILARKGVTLALSQASISGVDLAALSKLNVKFVCLAAASLSLGMKTPSAVSGFIQAARALRIQTVITQVTEPHLLADIMRSARLACGPAFAPPRRLKRTSPETESFSAAA